MGQSDMKPEVKYRLIEKFIQTEDEAILSQIQEILENADNLKGETPREASEDIFSSTDEDLVNRAKTSLKSVEAGKTRNIREFKKEIEEWKKEKATR